MRDLRPSFVGLDLAWTGRYESGVCRFEGDTPQGLECTLLETTTRPAEGFAAEIAALSGPVVAAVDAPLIVTPRRWAEREIGRRFGRYKASAHSANLDLLVRTGRTAGPDLGRALERRGFTLDPAALLAGERAGRTAIEVYPHALHVRLFDLTERLPYKAKPKRPVAFRRSVLCEYQDHLRGWLERRAPGVLRSGDLRRALANETARAARGRALKRLEDTLDGVTCALAAWLVWCEPESWETLGDLDGYVVVPREAGT